MARALNLPSKSVRGLPVIETASFEGIYHHMMKKLRYSSGQDLSYAYARNAVGCITAEQATA